MRPTTSEAKTRRTKMNGKKRKPHTFCYAQQYGCGWSLFTQGVKTRKRFVKDITGEVLSFPSHRAATLFAVSNLGRKAVFKAA